MNIDKKYIILCLNFFLFISCIKKDIDIEQLQFNSDIYKSLKAKIMSNYILFSDNKVVAYGFREKKEYIADAQNMEIGINSESWSYDELNALERKRILFRLYIDTDMLSPFYGKIIEVGLTSSITADYQTSDFFCIGEFSSRNILKNQYNYHYVGCEFIFGEKEYIGFVFIEGAIYLENVNKLDARLGDINFYDKIKSYW